MGACSLHVPMVSTSAPIANKKPHLVTNGTSVEVVLSNSNHSASSNRNNMSNILDDACSYFFAKLWKQI